MGDLYILYPPKKAEEIERHDEKPGKKLRDFKMIQKSLFETPIKPKEPENKSSSIELYDAIPKYFWGKASEKIDSTDPIERPFVFRGEIYTAIIFPTKIKDKG